MLCFLQCIDLTHEMSMLLKTTLEVPKLQQSSSTAQFILYFECYCQQGSRKDERTTLTKMCDSTIMMEVTAASSRNRAMRHGWKSNYILRKAETQKHRKQYSLN